MKEEEMHHHYGGKFHLLMFIGALAFLYGLGKFIRVTYFPHWPPYVGWMVGGLALILIGLIKKWWMMKKMK